MRKIVLLAVATIFVWACDGDCIKCHPSLMKNGKLDNNHKILNKCKNCHKISSNDLANMGSKCGQDCWDCHSIKKVMKIKIKEHAVLNKCIKCHVSLEDSVISGEINKVDTSFLNLHKKGK